jgi:hypothetical protein
MLGSLWNLVRSLGQTSVEVYEWQETDVRKPRLPSPPNFTKLTTQRPDLTFSGWNLAHAVVKADYLDRRNLAMPGFGFLLQAEALIEFGKSPLALKAGASKALNDVSSTSLSARVGQGLAILYGHSLGLAFTAHLRSHVQGLPASTLAGANKERAMADFLFANKHQTVVIESKGSFTLKANNPTAIKSVLRGALAKQVDPWMNYLQPSPSNGFVVYSCLREASRVPSALFVVDPEGGEGAAADVPFKPDQVLRENYASWLRAMRLPDAAARLLRATSDQENGTPTEVTFLTARIDGREYAFREDHFDWPPNYGRWQLPAIGIDLAVLRAISNAISAPNIDLADSLRDFAPQTTSERQGYASIFPDGSLLGSLDATPLDYENVRL